MTSRQAVYGGQAILEGVVIRGPRAAALAVRTAQGIVVRRRELRPLAERVPLLGLPFIRGSVVLWEALVLGLDALIQSADLVGEDEGERVGRGEVALAIAVAAVLAVGLFVLLPTLSVRLVEPWVTGGLGRNLVEGAVRVVILVAYIALIGTMPDIQRVLAYHGAEHKVIHALEAGDELTVERVRRYPVVHPRCGTSFLLQVALISALLFAFLGWPSLWERLLSRLALLPVVAGVAYEVIRVSWRLGTRGWLLAPLVAPGLWLQRLTTREPDDEQIEVAIRALDAARDAEAGVVTCWSGSSAWSSVTNS